jgi:glycosyltransferase involved in cell wall biosynthesis
MIPRLADLPLPPPNKSGWPWTEETPQLPASMHDGTPWPLVSIVTPSYNQGQYIEETIRSVLLQGYPNLEYVIIDGGSRDDTTEIVKKYEPWLNYWVSEPDRGQSDAINKGFTKSTGRILNWLNSDDYLERNALALVAKAFAAADEDVGAVAGNGYFINTDGGIDQFRLPSEISRETFLRFSWDPGVGFHQPACFFSRDAWEFGGPLSLDLRYCLDTAFFIKLTERFRIQLLPELIAYAHRHPSAKTVVEWPYVRGEVALLFATLPDGFGRASKIMNELIRDELAAQSLLALGNRTFRRLARAIGLRRVRRALQRLPTMMEMFSGNAK